MSFLMVLLLFVFSRLHAEYIHISHPVSYYASPNILSWRSANNYCTHICSSSLASIHSEQDIISIKAAIDQELLIDTAINGKIWIGLYYSERDHKWLYTDNTDFDYVQSDAVYTFTENNITYPSIGRFCVVMHSNNDLKWEILTENECDESAYFVCNHCNSKLVKYKLIHNQSSTFYEANNICSDTMATTLQTIHNENDYIQSMALCLWGTNSENDCWMGLHTTQQTWTDDTKLDYGINIKEYPWATNINYKRQGCCLLSEKDNFQWRIDECGEQKAIICNSPSELCHEQNWESLYEEPLWHFYNKCEIMEDANNQQKIIVNTDKQWINTNGQLVVEYMFKMTQINMQTGFAGVNIYNFPGSVCNYYFIGMTAEWHRKKIFIIRYYNSSATEIYSVYVNESNQVGSEKDTFYTLNIKINNGTYFEIQLDNVRYVLFNDDIFNNAEKPVSNISGFIGLTINNVLIHSKHLYVSGSSQYTNSHKTQIISDFAKCPKLPPYNFTINALQSQSICINITTKNITNITNNILDIIDYVSCIQIVDDAVNVALIDEKMEIKADIFVCLNNSIQVLTDKIQTINGVFNLTIDLQCHSLNNSIDPMPPIQNINSESPITLSSMTIAEFVVSIIVIVLCCCCIIAAIIHLAKNETRKFNNNFVVNRNRANDILNDQIGNINNPSENEHELFFKMQKKRNNSVIINNDHEMDNKPTQEEFVQIIPAKIDNSLVSNDHTENSVGNAYDSAANTYGSSTHKILSHALENGDSDHMESCNSITQFNDNDEKVDYISSYECVDVSNESNGEESQQEW